jgi:hypothetical protein
MHRFSLNLEDRQYVALQAKANLLSVTMNELIRRGIDRNLGLDGTPVELWTPPPDFVPRRPGVKFTR